MLFIPARARLWNLIIRNRYSSLQVRHGVGLTKTTKKRASQQMQVLCYFEAKQR